MVGVGDRQVAQHLLVERDDLVHPCREDGGHASSYQRASRSTTRSSAANEPWPNFSQRDGDQPNSRSGASALSLNGISKVIASAPKASAIQLVAIVMLALPGSLSG